MYVGRNEVGVGLSMSPDCETNEDGRGCFGEERESSVTVTGLESFDTNCSLYTALTVILQYAIYM